MHAYLVCEDCRSALAIGEVAWRSRHAGQVSHFQDVSGPSSTNARLSRAVWKMIADHTGHPMRVLLEHQLTPGTVEIGERGAAAMSLDDYLDDYEG